MDYAVKSLGSCKNTEDMLQYEKTYEEDVKDGSRSDTETLRYY